ncbi:MAG: hypothetical protein Q8R12_02475 [bacterium]|nr:hypothetical protein [bacterium]
MGKLVWAHWPAVFMAALVGVIIIAPPIIFRFDPAYRGIDLLGADGEASYVAQVHAIYNGNFSFGNVFLYEGQNHPYVKQPLPAIITAGLGKFFGLDVPNANLIAKFIFPTIIFLLVYALCFILTKRKGIALIGASFVLLSPATTALLDPATWGPLLKKGVFAGNDPQFLLYSRPISPQVSNLIFFAYLFALWTLWGQPQPSSTAKKYWLGALSSIFLGLSFYTYLFSYSLLFAMNGFLWLYFLIRRDFGKLKELTLITIGGLIVGIPYILNMLQVFNSPYYPELSVRVGQLLTRQLVLSRVWFGVVFLFLVFYRKLNSFGVFTLAFLGAIFAVSNQQFLTGRTVPIPQHYHWYYMAPLAGFIISHVAFSWLENKSKKNYLKALKIFLCVMLAAVAVLFQRWSYLDQKDEFVALQHYGPAINWLKNNAAKNDVVFSNESFSNLVVIYTPANVYYNGYAGDYLVPSERLRRAYYTYMYLEGIPSEDAEKYFSDSENRANFSNHIFGNYYRAKNGCYECYPAELNQRFIAEYQAFTQVPFLENLKKYRLTYAVWDKKTDPLWRLNRYFDKPVFEDGGVVVYRVMS